MKHIIRNISLVSLFAALCSCNQDQGMDYWSFATGDQEIEFTPKTDQNSKSVISGTAYPADESFAVTAWFLGENVSGENKKWNDWKDKTVQQGGPIQYIPSLNSGSKDIASKIERNEQTAYWKNRTQKFYWPAAGSLSFFIYSPYSLISDSGNDNITVSCTPSTGLKISDFDVTPAGGRLDSKGNPVAAGKQWNVDFMVTPLLANYTRDSIGTAVNAVFKHQLSTIQFYTKRAKDLQEQYKIYLKEIRIKRILSVASYSMYQEDDKKWSRMGQNYANEESEYVIFQSDANKGKGMELTDNAVVSNTLINNSPILVIPQILPLISGTVDSLNATIVIKYTKEGPVENPNSKNDDDKYIIEARHAEYYGDFKSIIAKWSPNKSYSYTLSIGGLETIHWDPSVEPFAYESRVLRPEIFNKDGQVSDDIVLSLIKQDTVNKYNNVYSKYGNYNFQVNEDCQGDIRDNLYFMWYQLRRPKQYGDKWVYPNDYSNYSYNWYASLEGKSGAFYINTSDQMDPYSLFKQVQGAGEAPYNTKDNCRNSVVFQLKRNSSDNTFYIYHPVADRYLHIDFSKSTDGKGNTDCATFVSGMSNATPLYIDFLGLYQDNKQYDNTTDGVQIYFDSYSDTYGDGDGTGQGIISHTTDKVTKQEYYVLGVNLTRTFQRYYITFENGTISFRTVKSEPVQIEKQYLYIADPGMVDLSAGWNKAHTEVGKLLNSACDINDIQIDDYNCSALMNLIPLNGAIKTEQKMMIDDDDVLSDFELRNVHGNADTYGSSNKPGTYKVDNIIKVYGDVYAKVNGAGPGLIEQDVPLTVTSISGDNGGAVYGTVLADGTIKVVSGESADGHAIVNCIAQLKNHPKYGSITPTSVNYKFDAYDRMSYALVLDPVEVYTDQTVPAHGTVYSVFNGVQSNKVVAENVEVNVTGVDDSKDYAFLDNGQIKGGAYKGETTYKGTYTYKDAVGASYPLTAENGKVIAHNLSYVLNLNPAEITVYYPIVQNNNTAVATGSIYPVIDGVQQNAPVPGKENVNVTITKVTDTSLATADGSTFTANTNRKYGQTTFNGSYVYNGKTLSASSNLTIHTVEYSLDCNTVTVSNETLNLSNYPAKGTLTTTADGATSGTVTVNLTVSGLTAGNTIAKLSSNTITALNTGNTGYSATYNYTNASNGYNYTFTNLKGTVNVTATVRYSLNLSNVSVNVGESVTPPTATLVKYVNGTQVSSNNVSVKASSTANTSYAQVSNGSLKGIKAGNTTYNASYSGEMGTITSATPATVTVKDNSNTLWSGSVNVNLYSWNGSETVWLSNRLKTGDTFCVECVGLGDGAAVQVNVGGSRWCGQYSIPAKITTTLTLTVPKNWEGDNDTFDNIVFGGYNYTIKKVYKK